MSTFYQQLLPGTTSIEADILIKRARKVDREAYLQTSYTIVYKDPKVTEAVYGKQATSSSGSRKSPGGED